MNEIREFRRGDVVLIPFPYITDFSKTGERPAVIIQNDVGNRFSPNLIAAAISSQIPRKEYPIHFLVRRGSFEAEGSGLRSKLLSEANRTSKGFRCPNRDYPDHSQDERYQASRSIQ